MCQRPGCIHFALTDLVVTMRSFVKAGGHGVGPRWSERGRRRHKALCCERSGYPVISIAEATTSVEHNVR